LKKTLAAMATYIERFIENERDSRHAADRLRTETLSLDLNMKVKLYYRPTTLKPM
jgi:ubiquinone biosynthesis protein UbiJ